MQRVSFEFAAEVQPVLEKAITRPTTMTPPERVTATGWVSVIERPKRREPGVVRLKVLAGSDARTLRVRLTEDQFEVAAEAIKAEQFSWQCRDGRNARGGRTGCTAPVIWSPSMLNRSQSACRKQCRINRTKRCSSDGGPTQGRLQDHLPERQDIRRHGSDWHHALIRLTTADIAADFTSEQRRDVTIPKQIL